MPVQKLALLLKMRVALNNKERGAQIISNFQRNRLPLFSVSFTREREFSFNIYEAASSLNLADR